MIYFSAKRITVLAILATLAATSYAQYIWLDEKGVKQYSDIPPGPSVPLNRILKEPVQRQQQATPAAISDKQEGTPAPAASASSPAQKGPLTTAEQNADFLKRKLEREEKEKKDAEQAKLAADKARNCERARAYSRSLGTAEKIVGTDKDGNRSYLTNEQRAKEASEVNGILSNCK